MSIVANESNDHSERQRDGEKEVSGWLERGRRGG